MYFVIINISTTIMSCKAISLKKPICQRKSSSKSVDTTSLNVVYSENKSLKHTKYVISHNFNKNNLLLIALDCRGDLLRSWSYVDSSSSSGSSSSKYILPMRHLKIGNIETMQDILDGKLIAITRTIFTNNGLLKIRQSEKRQCVDLNVAATAAAAADDDKLTIIPYDDTIFAIIKKCRDNSGSEKTNNRVKPTVIPSYRQVKLLDKNISYKDYKYIYID